MFKPTLTFSGFTMLTSLVKTKVTSKKSFQQIGQILQKRLVALLTFHLKFIKAVANLIKPFYL